MTSLVGRAKEAALAYARRGTNRALAAARRPGEGRSSDVPHVPLPHMPVFILGAPRSGTTVLYQLLVDRYRIGYFANIHCRWFGNPAWAERRHQPWKRPPRGDYDSRYGETKGIYGPSECGDFWYRFFPRRPQYVEEADVDPKKMAALRAEMRALVEAAGRPFLFKNLPCALRLLPLAATLPEARYVVIERDEIDVGHSLLEGRKRLHDDYAKWFSLEPPNKEVLARRPPEEQVIEQVRETERIIREHAARIGTERFLHVSYEALVADVPGTLDAVERFLADHGASLERRGEVPTTLESRGGVRIDADVYERMVQYARRR